MTFCRQVEAESSDPSLASACVDEFETQMRRLFLEARIWASENQGSWTRRILDQIKEARFSPSAEKGMVYHGLPPESGKSPRPSARPSLRFSPLGR